MRNINRDREICLVLGARHRWVHSTSAQTWPPQSEGRKERKPSSRPAKNRLARLEVSTRPIQTRWGKKCVQITAKPYREGVGSGHNGSQRNFGERKGQMGVVVGLAKSSMYFHLFRLLINSVFSPRKTNAN